MSEKISLDSSAPTDKILLYQTSITQIKFILLSN